MFKSIKKEIVTTIEIKKSKFISHLVPVKTEKEAKNIIEIVSTKFNDATHNCYGYSLDGGIITKAYDDGEPSKTAGFPILQALINNNLSNVCCVVTRYYGGTKLGTGGLMRAYSSSAIEAIKNANFVELSKGTRLVFEVEYSNSKDMEGLLKNIDINIKDIKYSETIIYTIVVKEEDCAATCNKVNSLIFPRVCKVVKEEYHISEN